MEGGQLADGRYGCILAVVLAAGTSTRMGASKLLLKLGGQTLIERSVSAALESGLAQTVVVLGDSADGIRQILARRWPDRSSLRLIYNDAYASGLSSSVKAGLAACRETARAVVFCLADQPLITGGTIRRVADAYIRSDDKPTIVLPIHCGRRGNPVLFDRRLFPEILMISGDTGARGIIDRHEHEVLTVECGPEILMDVDTVEDYERLRKEYGASGWRDRLPDLATRTC